MKKSKKSLKVMFGLLAVLLFALGFLIKFGGKRTFREGMGLGGDEEEGEDDTGMDSMQSDMESDLSGNPTDASGNMSDKSDNEASNKQKANNKGNQKKLMNSLKKNPTLKVLDMFDLDLDDAPCFNGSERVDGKCIDEFDGAMCDS